MSGYAIEHSTRKMIINHILTYPGVSFGTIKQVFNLTDGTLRYHLNYLESKNQIKSFLVGNNRCYYPVKEMIFDSKSDSEIKVHNLSDNQERLLNTIKRYPGITQKELISSTGLKRITVGHNIKKLIDFGVVRKEQNGRNICYYFISNTELRDKIRRRLITKFLNNEIDEQTFLALKRKLDKDRG
ncbi:winged helix-turn-helix transcriptional regulator [[Eubacterium] cellulosolvens]